MCFYCVLHGSYVAKMTKNAELVCKYKDGVQFRHDGNEVVSCSCCEVISNDVSYIYVCVIEGPSAWYFSKFVNGESV